MPGQVRTVPVLALAVVAFSFCNAVIHKSADQSNLNSLVGLDDTVIQDKDSIERQKLEAEHRHRPAPMAAPARAVNLDKQSALEEQLGVEKQRTCSEHQVCDDLDVPQDGPQVLLLRIE